MGTWDRDLSGDLEASGISQLSLPCRGVARKEKGGHNQFVAFAPNRRINFAKKERNLAFDSKSWFSWGFIYSTFLN